MTTKRLSRPDRSWDRADVLGLGTTRRELEAAYEAGRGALRGVLDPSLSSADLLVLAAKHARRIYSDPLWQLIATHSRATYRVQNGLFLLARSRPDVLNAIATSGRASRRLLSILKASDWASVREHASRALAVEGHARPRPPMP